MKKTLQYLAATIILVFVFLNGLSQDFLYVAEFKISIDDIAAADFSDNDKIESFIRTKIFANAAVQRTKIKAWDSDAELLELEDCAIIFLRHGYDIGRLNVPSSVTTLGRTVGEMKTNLKKIEELILKVRYNSISDSDYKILIHLPDFLGDSETFFDAFVYSAKFQNDAVLRKTLLELLDGKFLDFKNSLKQKQDSYDSKSRAIIENSEVITKVLHKEDAKWSEYLLNTKRILLVILGGEDDLATASVTIDNKLSEFENTLNDLKDLASQLGISLGGGDEIKCKVVELNYHKIKPPSNIILKHSSFKNDISFSIHENGFFQFKVGISASNVKKDNFVISNQQLTVKLDENSKTIWKDNLVAILEGNFWARDYDRFGSIFKKNDNTPLKSRAGYFIGVKLSKSPWDMVAAGFSFALTRDASINLGMSTIFTEKEQTVNVGSITSIDDAKKIADKAYSVPRLYIGLSFAPRIVTDALGLGKKKP